MEYTYIFLFYLFIFFVLVHARMFSLAGLHLSLKMCNCEHVPHGPPPCPLLQGAWRGSKSDLADTSCAECQTLPEMRYDEMIAVMGSLRD